MYVGYKCLNSKWENDVNHDRWQWPTILDGPHTRTVVVTSDPHKTNEYNQNSSVYYVNVPFKLPLGCKQCFNIWGFCVFKILCLVCHDNWRDYRRSTIRWRHFQPNIVPMLPMRIPKAVKGRFLRQLWLLTLSHGTSEIFHAPTAKNCIIPRPLSRSTF